MALSVVYEGEAIHYQFRQQGDAWMHKDVVFPGCQTLADIVALLRSDQQTALCCPLTDYISEQRLRSATTPDGALVCSHVQESEL